MKYWPQAMLKGHKRGFVVVLVVVDAFWKTFLKTKKNPNRTENVHKRIKKYLLMINTLKSTKMSLGTICQTHCTTWYWTAFCCLSWTCTCEALFKIGWIMSIGKERKFSKFDEFNLSMILKHPIGLNLRSRVWELWKFKKLIMTG